MSMDNAARPNGNRDHDIALYVARYEKLETHEVWELLQFRARRGTTPWQREAARKVLKARGETV
jgi:hypothetical protein